MRKIIILVWVAMLAGGAGSVLAHEKHKATPAPVPADTMGKAAASAPVPVEEIAVIETRFGNIELEFFPDKAPGHVKNFKTLAKAGFYNGTLFHRVIPGFMIQGGDSFSKKPDRSMHGGGGPGYTIKAEFNDTKHNRGILSMARVGGDPDSAGSQFFIVVQDSPHLDGQYTVFGRVIKGMEVADKIVDQIIAENVKQGVPEELVRMGRLKFTNPLEPISMKITIKPKK